MTNVIFVGSDLDILLQACLFSDLCTHFYISWRAFSSVINLKTILENKKGFPGIDVVHQDYAFSREWHLFFDIIML